MAATPCTDGMALCIPDYFESLYVRLAGLTRCRYLGWVATSNTTRDIPAPLLNRMRVFEISPPAADEMQEVIRRLAAGIWLATGGRAHAPRIGGNVLDLLVKMPFRSAKAAITEAFAKAVTRVASNSSFATFQAKRSNRVGSAFYERPGGLFGLQTCGRGRRIGPRRRAILASAGPSLAYALAPSNICRSPERRRSTLLPSAPEADRLGTVTA